MSRNIVFEGWLTKSPPSKRIFKTKWRRRWFALRQSGELPGQYFLDYYADRNYRRLKGTIDLDLCEQVDAGLHMERSGAGSLDPKLRGSVFTIQTNTRTYHLEADCEEDMEKWVDAICKVCGLRATEDSSYALGTYQSNMGTVAPMNVCANSTGPYIPISECITGVRAQDSTAFPFDPKDIVTSNRRPFDTVSENRGYLSQPHAEFSENESNLSDEECKSLNASQSNIGDWAVTKSFTRLAVGPKRNGVADDGPPVPPRPPKTLAGGRETLQKEPFHGPKINEPIDTNENVFVQGATLSTLGVPRRLSHGAPTSPGRALAPLRSTDDEDDYMMGHPSMQYCNLPPLPPAVDRALKPRHSSHSIGHINRLTGQIILSLNHNDDMKAEALQYLDLDLQTSKPATSKPQEMHRKKVEIAHGKSLSSVDTDAYKTVDFLKTEAFNITRQDAEASRNNRH